jgi:hypothetical protein
MAKMRVVNDRGTLSAGGEVRFFRAMEIASLSRLKSRATSLGEGSLFLSVVKVLQTPILQTYMLLYTNCKISYTPHSPTPN